MKKLIVLLFILYLHIISFAQTIDYMHMGISSGLSNNAINCIVQDTTGFIWIGTANGLNRYDGYEFVQYRQSAEEGSLPNNSINTLFVDSKGILWIGTQGGLCYYDERKNKFIVYQSELKNQKTISYNQVRCIAEDNNNNLWIGTGIGLNKFDRKTQSFTRYYDNKVTTKGLQGNSVLCCLFEQPNTLWLGTWEKGLNKLNTQTGEFSYYPPHANSLTPEINGCVLSIIKADNTNLWVGGAFTDGLLLFNTKTNSYNKDNSLATVAKVNHLLTYDSLNVWISTGYRLFVFNKAQKKLTAYENNLHNPQSISSNEIAYSYKDKTEMVWVGTVDGGLNIYDPNRWRFKNKIPDVNLSGNKLNRYVKSIYRDRSGVLWIGTDYGLNKLNDKNNIIKQYTHKPNSINGLNVGGVSSMYEDSKGRFWIGTWGGSLHLFDRQKETFKNYPCVVGNTNNKNISDVNIMSITEDNNGYIWIGTIVGTLERFNPETGEFKHFNLRKKDGNANALLYDRAENCIWCSSDDLIKLDLTTYKISTYAHNPQNTNTINSGKIEGIVKDNNRNCLWIATHNGLDCLELKSNNVKHYTEQNGMASSFLLSIQKDNNDCLWIGTEKGITKYDLLKQTFYNYDSSDGALENATCSYMSNLGELFFGGTNGVNLFYPNEIKTNENLAKVVFTHIKLFNKEINNISNKEVLTDPITIAKEINLSYKQTVLTLSFSALSYSISEKNKYAYKLEGFDKEWNNIGERHEVTFTNLDAGTYTLLVKAANNDGVWNNKPSRITLIVNPPFWNTWWFRLILISVILSSIYFTFKLRIRSIQKRQEILEQLVLSRTSDLKNANIQLQDNQQKIIAQKDKIEEMAKQVHAIDEMKIQFYANLSHEFLTPLTLILSPLEKVVSETEDSHLHYKLFQLLYRNALRLNYLIIQLLDIKKHEDGHIHVSLQELDIITCLQKVFESFSYQSQLKHINYSFHSNVANYTTCFDSDKVEKIAYNLISNAFKYTPDYGKIEISCSIQNEDNANEKPMYFQLIVKDTGIGIPSEEIDKIFDRFYQVDRSITQKHSGTGIGLAHTHELATILNGTINVKSNLHKGSAFTVQLPIFHNCNNEIIDKNKWTNPVLPFVSIEKQVANIPTEENKENKLSNTTILIIEDNTDLREYIASELTELYDIETAHNGKRGLERALQIIPDLIISDLVMPEINGFELCQGVKADERTSHIPVILLTVHSEEENQVTGLQSGADDYLTKPFNINILKLKIKNQLEARVRLRDYYLQRLSSLTESNKILSSDEKFLQRVNTYISTNISNPEYSVINLSNDIGLSHSQLFRKIRNLTGKSPNEFIRYVRLKKAAILLETTSTNIAEIAYEVGFNDPAYFSRSFSKIYGQSPTEYASRFNGKN